MTNKTTIFQKTFLIYTISNLGSKLLNTILFPIFSFYIIPRELGIFDLSSTIIYLFIPFFTLNIKDSIVRYLMTSDPQLNTNQVIYLSFNNLKYSLIIITVAGITIINYFNIPFGYWILVTSIVIVVFEIMLQISRGIGYTTVFAIGGILHTFIAALISIIGVTIFNLDITIVYFANILSRILAMIYIEKKVKILSYIKLDINIPSNEKRLFYKYSTLLLPNIFLFWIIDNSSRIFISNFLGIEVNGLYAIIIKFSNILLTFVFIFYQTWQEIAIRYFNTNDRDQFFSSVFNNYFLGMALAVIFIGVGSKIIYPVAVAKEYSEGLQYIIPLLVSSLFLGLSYFFDIIYQSSNQPKKGIPSIFISAIISIGLTYFLGQKWGLTGIISSAIITYFFLASYRFVDCRSILKINLEIKSLISLSLIILAILINMYITHIIFNIIVLCLSLTVFIILYGSPIYKNLLKK